MRVLTYCMMTLLLAIGTNCSAPMDPKTDNTQTSTPSDTTSKDIIAEQWENAETFFIIEPRLKQNSEKIRWLQTLGKTIRLIVALSAGSASGLGIYKLLTKDNWRNKVFGNFFEILEKLPKCMQFTKRPDAGNPIPAPTLWKLWLPVIGGGIAVGIIAQLIQKWLAKDLNLKRSIDLEYIRLAIACSTQKIFPFKHPCTIRQTLRHTFYDQEISPDKQLAVLRELRMLIEEHYAQTNACQ